MNVVAAGVHDVDGSAAGIGRRHGTRVGQARRFAHGKGVEIGSYHDRGAGPVLHQRDHAMTSHAGGDGVTNRAKFVGELGRGALLVQREFRVAMEMVIEGQERIVLCVHVGVDSVDLRRRHARLGALRRTYGNCHEQEGRAEPKEDD